MRYGAMNFPIKPVLKELEAFANLGFNYLELTLDPPLAHYSIIRKQKGEILEALQQHGMALVCHLPTFLSTADLTQSIRDVSLHEILRSLETASELEAEKVVLHPSHIGGMGIYIMEKVKGYAFDSLGKVVLRADQLGICLCFENMFPKCMAFFELDDFIEVFDIFPDLKMTLDMGHACIDSPKGKRLFDFLRIFGDRIGHVHASDNHGKRDDHLPIGKGSIDFPKVVKALKEIGYNDTVTLEVFSENRMDLKISREKFAGFLQGSLEI